MNIQSIALPNTADGLGSSSKTFIDYDMFLRLLVAQLTTQNPLEPMNDRDFFAQMAQLGTVQGVEQLRQSLQMTQATSLIGSTVEIRSSSTGENIIGVVESVQLSGSKVYLVVGGNRYSVSDVVQVGAKV